MPRTTVSSRFRNEIEASVSGDVALMFVTITHQRLTEPIRLVGEDNLGVSFQNGRVVNYKYEGNLYLGCPFECELVTDTDRPPQSTIRMPDVDGTIGIGILALVESPRLSFKLMALADFSSDVDADNARTPIGTPHVEYAADHLYLRKVTGDAMQVTAELFARDLTIEFWPRIRTTQDRLPGLYR